MVVSVVLAVGLGGIVYLSSSSLPYLASSPTGDPAFGALNGCLLAAMPERVGFAVSRDGKKAAAWSTSKIALCEGEPPTAVSWERAGVTLGAFDHSGALWISQDGHDAGPTGLWRLEAGDFVERGAFSAAALTGTREGVVAVDPLGQLVAIGADGTLFATRPLPMQRNVHLVTDAGGTMVALFGGGKFSVVNAKSLASTPAEAPCPVKWTWWRPGSPLLLVECTDLTFEINAIDSTSQLMEPRRRIHSTLVGADALYVQACDQLPCSATPPQ